MKEHSISIEGKPGMIMKAEKLLRGYQLKGFSKSMTFKLMLILFFLGKLMAGCYVGKKTIVLSIYF